MFNVFFTYSMLQIEWITIRLFLFEPYIYPASSGKSPLVSSQKINSCILMGLHVLRRSYPMFLF